MISLADDSLFASVCNCIFTQGAMADREQVLIEVESFVIEAQHVGYSKNACIQTQWSIFLFFTPFDVQNCQRTIPNKLAWQYNEHKARKLLSLITLTIEHPSG